MKRDEAGRPSLDSSRSFVFCSSAPPRGRVSSLRTPGPSTLHYCVSAMKMSLPPLKVSVEQCSSGPLWLVA